MRRGGLSYLLLTRRDKGDIDDDIKRDWANDEDGRGIKRDGGRSDSG